MTDFSWAESHLVERINDVANNLVRPSVLYRPKVFQDGNAFCCLYGDDIQSGVCAFGRTPSEAVDNFDFYVWYGKPIPAVPLVEGGSNG